MKCTAGSRCPAGSSKDMSYLPLGILIIFDMVLITAAIIVKIKQRFFAKHQRKHSFRTPKQAKALASKMGRSTQYQEISDPEAASPYDYRSDYEMTEPRMNTLRHRPTGFEQLGAIEDFTHEEHFNKNAEEERTDLHLFVESLSKCIGNSNFGLSFEFEDLRFQPKKSPKPILSEVSGRINSGALWGVMGASGAGKCEFLFQSLLDPTADDQSYIRQCPHGKDLTYRRRNQGQWGSGKHLEVCESKDDERCGLNPLKISQNHRLRPAR